MQDNNILYILTMSLHSLLVIVLAIRIILRRRPLSTLLAWLAIILSFPILGGIIYLAIGESRVSEKYLKRIKEIHPLYDHWRNSLFKRAIADESYIPHKAHPVYHLAQAVDGLPVLKGNLMTLFLESHGLLDQLIEDINQAQTSCHLEFYIWDSEGRITEVENALILAAQRGVECRLLLDDIGSGDFLKSTRRQILKNAGVEIAVSFPVGLFTTIFSRADIRNHRKVIIIDSAIGYTGSQNMADPSLFKRDEDVGEWIDAMTRMEGPVVEELERTFSIDWQITTGIELKTFHKTTYLKPHPEPAIAVQVMPSGPFPRAMAIQKIMLTLIYASREELIITSPYFVPDEAIHTALISAANRQVKVKLVVPDKNDSKLVKYAGQSFFEELLEAGVEIYNFNNNLLHTKSITVDGEFCLFGSVNMDIRSLWLNFELSLIIYNQEFTRKIVGMQESYIQQSSRIHLDDWKQRHVFQRLLENSAQLAAPLL